jgi:hypothetical protein
LSSSMTAIAATQGAGSTWGTADDSVVAANARSAGAADMTARIAALQTMAEK